MTARPHKCAPQMSSTCLNWQRCGLAVVAAEPPAVRQQAQPQREPYQQRCQAHDLQALTCTQPRQRHGLHPRTHVEICAVLLPSLKATICMPWLAQQRE